MAMNMRAAKAKDMAKKYPALFIIPVKVG